MGYQIAWFTTQPDKPFICFICTNVVKTPLLVKPCQHIFCSACVTRSMQRSKICVVDGCYQEIEDVAQLPRPYLDLLNNLEMQCPFKSVGCDIGVLKLGQWSQHEETCTWNPENRFNCEGGCGAELSKYMRRIGSHNCVEYLKKELEICKERRNSLLDCVEYYKEQLKICKEELAISKRNELPNGSGNTLAKRPVQDVPRPGWAPRCQPRSSLRFPGPTSFGSIRFGLSSGSCPTSASAEPAKRPGYPPPAQKKRRLSPPGSILDPESSSSSDSAENAGPREPVVIKIEPEPPEHNYSPNGPDNPITMSDSSSDEADRS